MLRKRVDLYNKSRMTGDCHVRFCERLEGKFLRPTRLPTVIAKIVRQKNRITMKIEDSVRVKKGVKSPDYYKDLLIEGWQG
jgi:hypothetical protein